MSNITYINLEDIKPYIRYVNNYKPVCSYVEKERIIFDYEFMYVMEGSADIYYDGIKYQLNKSDVFYIKPGVKNQLVVDVKNGFRTHCIHFDWARLPKEYDFTAEEFYMHSVMSLNHYEKEAFLKVRPHAEPLDFDVPVHIKGVAYEKLAPLFEGCYYEFICKTKISELRLNAEFMKIIAELLESGSASETLNIMHPKIRYAIEYIKSDYAGSITTKGLAAKYGLSPKYFGTIFKQTTGKSISEFVLEQRIYAAKEMLIGTDLTIEEIAEKAGFSNQFYFSKCFKEKEKLVPSEYRNVMRNY